MSPAPKKSGGRKAATRKATAAAGTTKKDTSKLVGRFALDFAATRGAQLERSGVVEADAIRRRTLEAEEANPALLRLRALEERDAGPEGAPTLTLPVDVALPNWTPMGPLAVPNGQAFRTGRVLISGRVTAIAAHPTDADRIYIGTSRGGVWRTDDGGQTWSPLGDHEPSLAIGALAIGKDNPNVLYAGTGEGNVQRYSTAYPLDSAPGVYLGVGVLRSTDGGATWTLHATSLLANHSFYRIAVDRSDSENAFAATSRGLCRTTDGVTWTVLSGNGLPPISASVIACTDVLIDHGDTSGNTVYAAFWGSGIYRSTNALSRSPTFAPLTAGLPPAASTSRVSLKQSASSPARKYALVAGSDDRFLGLFRTMSAAGTTWELCTDSPAIEVYGAFTSDVNVDPTTPDVAYVSGVGLYKCRRDRAARTWTVDPIGDAIHADHHSLAFHPTQNQTIYAGNDGGFFVSRDAGSTWDDTPNEGLCLMQYEAIDNHGASDAVVQCGTQDNGTQQYRNSPVHYHGADGDGGYCTISKVNGNNVTHSYFGNTPRRSTAGGEFGTYTSVQTGLDGDGLFYPPCAISPTSERMAWATNVVNVDDGMGSGGWPGGGVALPGIDGAVSAVSFASDSLIYCATTSGQVYRLDLSRRTWRARPLHAGPLPAGQWIWDIVSVPGDANAVLVAFSGFGLADHVWRGTVPARGTATWAPVSGGLPDVPMYALCPESAGEWFVGTDIGVFRTTDAGTSWSNYSQGLPNTAVYDLRLRSGSNLLRAATHGRGLWEIRTDVTTQPTVDLFVRDHLMHDGRAAGGGPATAAWQDATHHVPLNAPCHWWECADIKTDAPPDWQLRPSEANYLNFETRLVHESPEKGNQNRVYVQVHNRGPLPASDVTVKVMTAGASAGLPDLPPDFWTAWPNGAGDANWAPVGSPKTIDVLEPLRPTVLRWTWTPAPDADTHTCVLVVVDSPSDPIPESAKVLPVAPLVTGEKHVGLKNVHVVDLLPDAIVPVPLSLHASTLHGLRYLLRLPSFDHPDLRLTMLFSKALSKRLQAGENPPGLTSTKFSSADLKRLKERWLSDEMRSEDSWERLRKTYDVSRQYRVARGEVDVPVTIERGGREEVLLLARGAADASVGSTARTAVQQLTTQGEVVGGSTFVFRSRHV